MQNTEYLPVIVLAGRTPLTQDEDKQIHSVSILGISYKIWHPLSGQMFWGEMGEDASLRSVAIYKKKLRHNGEKNPNICGKKNWQLWLPEFYRKNMVITFVVVRI